jgi:hypothetical protein
MLRADACTAAGTRNCPASQPAKNANHRISILESLFSSAFRLKAEATSVKVAKT